LNGARLRRVDERDGADIVRASNDLGHRVDRAQHIRRVRQGDDAGSFRQQSVPRSRSKTPCASMGICRNTAPVRLASKIHAQDCYGAHFRQEDLIPRTQLRCSPGVRDQVDRLRGVAGEDDLIGSR